MLESIFSKVAGLTGAVLLKKEIPTEVFSYKYCEIFKNTFFIEHLWWLILQYLEIFMKTYFRGRHDIFDASQSGGERLWTETLYINFKPTISLKFLKAIFHKSYLVHS